MLFALVGNQNSGKTTLFNRLTGSDRHTGNYPGVTVDAAVGEVRNAPGCSAVDLPGLYALRPFSGEEDVALDMLKSGAFQVIINVADASNLDRGLYLTLQLLSLGRPLVLALNMMDEVEAAGGRIDEKKLSRALGIPVVPVSASKNWNLDTLLSTALEAAGKPPPKSPLAAAADEDRADVLRYAYIDKLLGESVYMPVSGAVRRTRLADKLLTGKYTAIPIFLLLMAGIFILTFDTVGGYFQNMFSLGLEGFERYLNGLMTAWNVHPLIRSLISEGVIGGVGSVLGFLPVILILFFFLSLLEDTGYMARVAFILDRPMRYLGLSGRSVVPLLMGFGCTVPAVMAARALTTRRDRWKTIFLTPYISCPAKLPVYAAVAGVFFPGREAWVMLALYVFGVLAGMAAAAVMKFTGGKESPFLMELPVYRLPTPRSVTRLMWSKGRDFVERAFTVIFLASVAVWFLRTLGPGLMPVSDCGDSLLAMAGQRIAPIFKPLGFGNWQVSAALIAGLTAKEAVVSTLGILLGNNMGDLGALLDGPGAVSLLTFVLLYTPCAAAVVTVKKELDSAWGAALFTVGQCLVAFLAAMAVHGFCLAFWR